MQAPTQVPTVVPTQSVAEESTQASTQNPTETVSTDSTAVTASESDSVIAGSDKTNAASEEDSSSVQIENAGNNGSGTSANVGKSESATKTGDRNNVILFIATALAAAGVWLFYGKKKEEKESK